MSEIIQRNKQYLVKSKYGSYLLNSRKTAEQLNKTLTDYENIKKTQQQTEKQLDKIQRILIQLQMTNTIQTHELETLKEALQ
jgi:pantothenate synthetase